MWHDQSGFRRIRRSRPGQSLPSGRRGCRIVDRWIPPRGRSRPRRRRIFPVLDGLDGPPFIHSSRFHRSPPTYVATGGAAKEETTFPFPILFTYQLPTRKGWFSFFKHPPIGSPSLDERMEDPCTIRTSSRFLEPPSDRNRKGKEKRKDPDGTDRRFARFLPSARRIEQDPKRKEHPDPPFPSKAEERSASRRISRRRKTFLPRGIPFRLDPAPRLLFAHETDGLDGLDRTGRNAERFEVGRKERSLHLACSPTPIRSTFPFPREIEVNTCHRGKPSTARTSGRWSRGNASFSRAPSSLPLFSLSSRGSKAKRRRLRARTSTSRSNRGRRSAGNWKRRTGTHRGIALVPLPSARIPRAKGSRVRFRGVRSASLRVDRACARSDSSICTTW